MKTDFIFFEIFQTMPQLFFEILGEPANRGDHYEFKSVELKQTSFRIDGVLTPKPDSPENTVIFVEFQFQKDEVLYERFFSEIMLYFAQYPAVENWQAIAVYPRRSIEQKNQQKYRVLIDSHHFQAIYLDDFLDMNTEDIGIQLMQLIVSPKKETDRYLNGMVEQLKSEDIPNRQGIIKLVSTVMIYKFPQFTREDICAMFTVSDMKKTRVYQDALQEGIELGRAEALQRDQSRLVQFLTYKLGELPTELEEAVRCLSFEQLESLSKAFFDFEQMADLEAWLTEFGDRPSPSFSSSPSSSPKNLKI